MSGNPKFLISEQSGVEFGTATEYIPDTTDINHISTTTLTAFSQIQAAKDLQFVFAGANPYLSYAGTTLTTAAYLLYQGSNVIQKPTGATVIAWVTGGTGTIRLQDITNNLTIATANTTSGTTASMLSLGTLSNIPTGPAVWAIQASVTGLLTAINISALWISFS